MQNERSPNIGASLSSLEHFTCSPELAPYRECIYHLNRLPGFKGPIPPPLLIRVRLFSYWNHTESYNDEFWSVKYKTVFLIFEVASSSDSHHSQWHQTGLRHNRNLSMQRAGIDNTNRFNPGSQGSISLLDHAPSNPSGASLEPQPQLPGVRQ